MSNQAPEEESIKGNKYIFDDLTHYKITDYNKNCYNVQFDRGHDYREIYVPKSCSRIFFGDGGKVTLFIETWFWNKNKDKLLL